MNNNIVLIGFMGTGKDVVGRKIAGKTDMSFFSTDDYIVLKENRTINEIFKKFGESYFRRLEKEAVNVAKDLRNTVIATGGGAVINATNRLLLAQAGSVIHLDAQLDVIEKRLKSDATRPLIKDKREIRRIFKERENLYKFADFKVDTSNKSPCNIAHEVLNKLRIKQKFQKIPLHKIPVQTNDKQYPVFINYCFLTPHNKFLKLLKQQSKRVVFITNPLVGTLYLKCVEDAFEKNGIKAIHFIVPDGEEYKSMATVAKIYDFLLKNEIERAEPIIALGGGVIGDLTGFVASTYKRGTPFIQIPTTLLAQVDAAIGGKTGVNHPLGKNMIGTFYQPDYVLADIGTLLSLPDVEFRNGMAEVIKYGIIKDKRLFNKLIEQRHEILRRNIHILQEIVLGCVKIKKEFVEKDEKEQRGIRQILNYGHTVGHIIETLTGYAQFRHGEALAIGMVVEAKFAVENRLLSQRDFKKIKDLIASYGLPVELPKKINLENIKKAILQDKKVRYGRIKLPVPKRVGNVIIKEARCEKF